MKTLLLVLAAAGLSGCAVYPAPVHEVYGGAGAPYVLEPPVYIQGGASYGSYGYGGYPRTYVYPRGYYRGHPGAAPRHWTRPNAHPARPGRGARDCDRDGDGVRNRHDHRPNDPGRR
jgi:hypothetical protein